jgi:nucleoside-diphosphate-sugar epimerase
MILITGGSGFIGRYIIKLLDDKYGIINFDIKKPDFRFLGEYIQGDILNINELDNAAKKATAIIHLAAKHNDIGLAEEYNRINVGGAENIINVAQNNNINKIILFSTVAVYGNVFSHVDENSPLKPQSDYGKSKLKAETLFNYWAQDGKNRRLIIIRPAVVIGPYNYANMFKLIKQIDKGLYAHIGKGNNIKSIAYVENVAEATKFILEHVNTNISIYNYSDEPPLTTRQITNIIKNSLSKNKSILLPYYIAYFIALIFDIFSLIIHKDLPISSNRIKKLCSETYCLSDKIRKDGFMPTFTSIEGLHKMIEWYKNLKKREVL